MMKIFNSIGHFFAWLAGTAIPTAATDIAKVQAVVESPIASAIAQLGGAKAQNVQAAINALGGQALAVLVNTGAAIASKGVNIVADDAVIGSVEQAVADIRAVFSGKAVPVAAQTQVVAPTATPSEPTAAAAALATAAAHS